jgi:hypothetical protein
MDPERKVSLRAADREGAENTDFGSGSKPSAVGSGGSEPGFAGYSSSQRPATTANTAISPLAAIWAAIGPVSDLDR